MDGAKAVKWAVTSVIVQSATEEPDLRSATPLAARPEKRTQRSQLAGSRNRREPEAVLETAPAKRWKQRGAKIAESWQRGKADRHG